MGLLVGTKVQLKERYAKWHLDHLEIYFYPNGTLPVNSGYEEETQLHLMACMGVPVIGKITNYGLNDLETNQPVYGVTFSVGRLKMFYYVERCNVIVLD